MVKWKYSLKVAKEVEIEKELFSAIFTWSKFDVFLVYLWVVKQISENAGKDIAV